MIKRGIRDIMTQTERDQLTAEQYHISPTDVIREEKTWLQELVEDIVERESKLRGQKVAVDDAEVIRQINAILFNGVGDSMRHRAIEKLAAQRNSHKG
jgi:hypothetical protein